MTVPGFRGLATVIGGNGFIGSGLAQRLRSEGWDCKLSPRDDPRWLERELGTVFYCAGLTADYAQRPFDTVRAHVGLLGEVLQAARFDTLVYLSSTRLYDSLPGLAGDEDRELALNPANPRHLYDLSKALGESLCRQANGGQARIARLSCVWAGGGAESGFIGALIDQVLAHRAAGNGSLIIDTSAYLERDYVHIDDVLDALLMIATRGTQPAYNVASGTNVGNLELFACMSKIAGCEVLPLRWDRGPRTAAAGISRMQHEFGWQPASVLDKLESLLHEALRCSA